MAIELKDDNFEKEVLNSVQPVMVDFWATWCMPCKMIAPIVEELSLDYRERAKICKLNVDNSPSIAANYGIMSVPTFIIFKGGKAVDKVIGALPKAALKSFLDKNI